ncbi:MAG: helix-turn-helix domain-containing protein [Actinomycetes bacterium]|jgi:transcriptional regulator with XRE-family HTH domain|nr:helix-turn-helix domain-containing protein [Actinomycetes bacterium]
MIQDCDYKLFLRQLGAQIQSVRKCRKLSQEALAQKVGLDRVSIGYIEQGVRAPSMKTLLNIAIALNVDVSSLLQYPRATDRQQPQQSEDTAPDYQ